MKLPDIRYACSGEVRIAYQVMGQGAFDLVFVPGFLSNLEVHWEDPGFVHLLRRLSAFSRLILFDPRGTGLSDRLAMDSLPDLRTRMDDIRAVMEAAGSGRAVLLGTSEGVPVAVCFAATYPEKVRSLVLYGGCAWHHDNAAGPDRLQTFLDLAERSWGTGASLQSFAPTRMDDPHFRSWWARLERLSVSPSAAMALARMNAGIDVRELLPGLRVQTLILHRREDQRVRAECGRELAAKIPGAEYVELAGRDHPMWTGDVDAVVDAIESHLAGGPTRRHRYPLLAAVLAFRVPNAERLLALPATHSERERFERFRVLAAEVIARHAGVSFGSSPDLLCVRFDAARRATQCCLELRDLARGLRIKGAAGLHAGEIDISEDIVSGAPVGLAERIAQEARSDEILVSGLIVELTDGCGFHYSDFRELSGHDLRRPLPIARAIPEQHLEPAAAMKAEIPLAVLSDREREVLALVAEGLSNSRIAERLQLSEHTVKRHVANILVKLDLPSRAAAAAVIARSTLP